MQLFKILIFVFVIVTSFSNSILSGAEKGLENRAPKVHSVDYFKDMNKSIDMNCGPNCLWQVMHAYNKDYSFKEIIDAADTSAKEGTSMKSMVAAANKMGLPAKAVKTNLKRLIEDNRIPILLLNLGELGHYVILDSINNGCIRLLDSNKFIELSADELAGIWDGYAIMIGLEEKSPQYMYFAGLIFLPVGIIMLFARVVKNFRKRVPVNGKIR